MNTKTMEQFKSLNSSVLANIEGGIPYGWYAPFGYYTDNIICRNGYRYTQSNWNSGNCQINVESVVNGVVSEMAMAIAGASRYRPK